mmetsp:Transcript_14751/g.23239  ORF Transcript_14751/g.23239 Transcript_14751/m.23239 type:complete len:280 (-) Transcript_14751:100-939(-)
MATALSQAYLTHKVNQATSDIENAMGGGDTFEDEHADGQEAGRYKAMNKPIKTTAVLAVCAGTLVINVLVMAAFGGVVTIAAGIVASVVCITVAGAELQLEDLESLREVQNGLRADVNVFSGENKKLGSSIDELNVQAFCLKETEQRLKEVTKDQEINVKSLVSIVDENQDILDAKRKMILQDIISDLMDTVMKGETGEDNEFSKKEINRMMTYMRGLPAVEVNEELLRKAIEKSNSVLTVMNLINDIGEPGNQEGDQIFRIDTDDTELQERVLNRSSS